QRLLGDAQPGMPEGFFTGSGGLTLDSSEGRDRDGKDAAEDEGDTQGFHHGVSLLRVGQDRTASRNPHPDSRLANDPPFFDWNRPRSYPQYGLVSRRFRSGRLGEELAGVLSGGRRAAEIGGPLKGPACVFLAPRRPLELAEADQRPRV